MRNFQVINFFLNSPPSSWRSELLLCFLIIKIIGISLYPFLLSCQEAHSQIRNPPVGTLLVLYVQLFSLSTFSTLFSLIDLGWSIICVSSYPRLPWAPKLALSLFFGSLLSLPTSYTRQIQISEGMPLKHRKWKRLLLMSSFEEVCGLWNQITWLRTQSLRFSSCHCSKLFKPPFHICKMWVIPASYGCCET